MSDLIVTLGHNSSAIVVSPTGEIIAGYEEERFSGKKADSAYPYKSIEMASKHQVIDDIYVGHWYVSGELPDQLTDKHIDLNHLESYSKNIHSIDPDINLTHHDSHCISAINFAGSKFPRTHSIVVVADGFGTMGESVSVYDYDGRLTLLRRMYGYDKSLGLLYQFATSYMGMKEHNHEYKMLAYESHILELGLNMIDLHRDIDEDVKYRLKTSGHIRREFDPAAMVSALTTLRFRINSRLDAIVDNHLKSSRSNRDIRILISYYVQAVVEHTMLSIISGFKPTNVILSGGLFYNVKLNSLVADQINGMTCVYPIAGDQGSGIGVYEAYKNKFKWPNNVFFGLRDLSNFTDEDDVIVFSSMDDAMMTIIDELGTTGFVNIVRGAMEFGPRSLCNTCTLGIPTAEVVSTINRMNDRTDEMPMAPVMTEAQAQEFFVDTDKIYKSLEYMVVARTYKPDMAQKVNGAAHYYSTTGLYTGRPQVTHDHHLMALLEQFGPLINTSYNYHGKPIVFERDSILETIRLQRKALPDIAFQTIIISGE